ncbi:carboxypeptidase-like regulatory domain-containing protein [Flagellimonas marinaquae]|uniref:carboxypeptidase-like regulatory domain-containing protein n=1 Tax=Flagellimonas marinaquae TaxID=254955 RepID=UPI000F8EABF8|nr:carboxypeptidase-like regulatory domain-containing protein [Allomuricauda aquimarina]
MKNLWILFLVITTCAFSQTAELRTIRGTITDGTRPIEDVAISIEGSNETTFSNELGNYSIEAKTGDLLSYSYTGLKTIQIKVEDVTQILNLEMFPDINDLDEVEVTASRRKSQKDLAAEYRTNPRIVKTAYGFLDTETAAGRVNVVPKENINAIFVCLLDFARVRIPGIVVTGDCTYGGAIYARGFGSINNSAPVIYDIDGLIFTDTPLWFDINNAERIALIQSLSLTVPYGFVGAGGVMVINTKTGSPAARKVVDQARLRNNYLEREVLTENQVRQNAPEYLKEFTNSESMAESREIFERYAGSYSNSSYFILDAIQHFSKRWKAYDMADAILDEHWNRMETNPVLLKTLAYFYEEQGRFDKANDIYKEVFILRPNYVQSYLDMAKSYRTTGQIKQAASIFARYEYLVDEEFLPDGENDFATIFQREYNNLLTLERKAILNNEGGKSLYVAEEDFKGTRLVFEWSDGEAEFDLMFVNPENQYYTWKHSLADNAEEIMNEKNLGYNIKEYLIDGSLPGLWKVNVNYKGNKSLTPSYLKATIYTDYGTPNQKIDVKVFRLGLKNVYQELFKINASTIVSN